MAAHIKQQSMFVLLLEGNYTGTYTCQVRLSTIIQVLGTQWRIQGGHWGQLPPPFFVSPTRMKIFCSALPLSPLGTHLFISPLSADTGAIKDSMLIVT